MKDESIQRIVLRLHKQGLSCRQISNQLTGEVSKTTINEWVKRYRNSGKIDLRKPPGAKRTKRTKKLIQSVRKGILQNKTKKSAMKLAKSLNVSRATIRRVIKDDLGLKSYVKRVAPKLTASQKKKRFSFCTWARKHVTKKLARNVLFSDEKKFDLNGAYNKQNDRIYASSRQEADENGGVYRKAKFPKKVMVWLGACYNGVTRPIIIEEGTVNQEVYIQQILPIALEDGKKLIGDEFIFQQDGATSHTANETQQWCENNFWDFWPKYRWPPNSPDLNPLDYSIWNELCTHMRWDKITSKPSLIKEIKNGVKKIPIDVVRRSVDCWTNRVYQILQNDCDYIN